MYEDQIESLDDWFEAKMKNQDEYWQSTYHHTEEKDGEDVYVVDYTDLKEFGDYLSNEEPDLIYIPCKFSQYGIQFTSEDLKNASFY